MKEPLPEDRDHVASVSHPVDLPLNLPLDFEAFYLTHEGPYHGYAEAHLGNRRSAEEVVHRVFVELLAVWDELLRDSDLEQRTWSVLRRLVRDRLASERRPPAYLVNGPIAQLLRAAQNKLRDLESTRGLYAAIGQLPPRQCDVIVLRHIMGHSTWQVARFMGLDERTVDYHHRKAKERLRATLGMPAEGPAGPPDAADESDAADAAGPSDGTPPGDGDVR